jgi:hypothetical protein
MEATTLSINPLTKQYEESAAPNAEGIVWRKSAFRDERGPGIYHLDIPVAGGTLYAVELNDDEFEEYLAIAKHLGESTRKMIAVEAQAKDLEEADKHKEAQDLRASVDSEATACIQGERDIKNWLFEKTLVGWSFKRPFSLKAFCGLSSSEQSKASQKIADACNVGRETDFLAAVS